ncbi:MAG: flagellar hook-basal body complex protein FliE, partial [Clostridiaceae bacterium]|nr:flagellar hook-basal body complex protein FliE [Clostridiaceae bacterium]
MNITGLSSVSQAFPVQNTQTGNKAEKTSFKDMLMDAIMEVSRLEKQSDIITEDFIA